jgi:hypothetical protein
MLPEIEAPDLDMPGKRASDWKKPIQRESFQVIESRDRNFFPSNSARRSKMLVQTKNTAADIGLLKACSNVSLNIKANIPAGIVARIKYQPNRASGSPKGVLVIMPWRTALPIESKSFQ